MACQLLKGGAWANDAEPTNTVASRRLFTSLCFFMPEQIPLRARERLTFTGDVPVAVRLAEGPAKRSRQARLKGTKPALRRTLSSSARKAP